MSNIPFTTIDWTTIDKIAHDGETGMAFWQTMQFPGLRIRIVEYSDIYLAAIGAGKGILYTAWRESLPQNRKTAKK
ncbi:hypothetical protein [Mucilaginibacter sp.]|uniref:hypothetical protein n=1 Tax=Mucilaginibacter sp. TaxID=1882438 RepID=UPI0025E8B4B2|nr:hypothetical protein [Mucilaginibacter sp.]